jgi:hypothetical protein
VLNNSRISQIPKLSASRWENILQRLIVGRQLDTAETLLLQLIARPEFAARAPELLQRLTWAFEHAGQPEKAKALERLADRFAQRPAESKAQTQ